jgi:hypothetical protein
MKHLNTQPNFGTPGERPLHAYTPGDDFYDLLIQGHAGLSDADSEGMNARLVLLLANHIGDLRVLREAIAAARPAALSASLAGPEEPSP